MLFVYSDKTNIEENKYLVLLRVHVFSTLSSTAFYSFIMFNLVNFRVSIYIIDG